MSSKTKESKWSAKNLLQLCALAVFFIFMSCSSPPIDLQAVAPVDSLIYLETNDLGGTLEALTENETFRQYAQSATDFSLLREIQVAVVVTGFEASEKELTDQNSILNFKPRFVAIADTHLWESQTKRLTEESLGSFINRTYGGEVDLETSPKHDGSWYEWTAIDGRNVFAYVEGSQIFFGNDETAIEKCLSVKRGETENLTTNQNFSRAIRSKTADDLTFGYIAPEGIAQVANIIGVSTAIETTEDDNGRSFIARVLPEILRNTTNEIIWTSSKNEKRIEDKFVVTTKGEVASVLVETMKPAADNQSDLAEFLPQAPYSATRYNLQNPQVAWRSLIVTTSKNADELSGELIRQFSESLLEPYGIKQAEEFLSAVGSEILTAQFDAEGERSIAIVKVKDPEKVKKSIIDEINFAGPSEKKEDAQIWVSKDKLLSAAFVDDVLILGDAESVDEGLKAKKNGKNFTVNSAFEAFSKSKATATTYTEDLESGEKMVELLGVAKQEGKDLVPMFITETGFTKQGVERRTVSDFGIIGMILEQIEE